MVEIKKEKIAVITSEAEIERICKEVLAANQQAVADFKRGEEKAFNFLIGKVMQATKGRASPEIVNRAMKKLLK